MVAGPLRPLHRCCCRPQWLGFVVPFHMFWRCYILWTACIRCSSYALRHHAVVLACSRAAMPPAVHDVNMLQRTDYATATHSAPCAAQVACLRLPRGGEGQHAQGVRPQQYVGQIQGPGAKVVSAGLCRQRFGGAPAWFRLWYRRATCPFLFDYPCGDRPLLSCYVAAASANANVPRTVLPSCTSFIPRQSINPACQLGAAQGFASSTRTACCRTCYLPFTAYPGIFATISKRPAGEFRGGAPGVCGVAVGVAGCHAIASGGLQAAGVRGRGRRVWAAVGGAQQKQRRQRCSERCQQWGRRRGR